MPTSSQISNPENTAIETVLKSQDILITRTDLAGRIDYANERFCDISGFSQRELLGSPHSIIRHPDMPAVVFQLLWQTLEADQPWIGIIKNRSRSGNYYWVEASIFPIFEEKKKVGYMSVRCKPSPTDRKAAEISYAHGRCMHMREPGFNLLSVWKNLSLMKRMSVAIIATLAILGGQMVAVFLEIPELLYIINPMLAVVLALSTAVSFTHRLRNVQGVTGYSEQIATGRLNLEIPFGAGRNEIARLQRAERCMVVSLRGIITQIGNITDQSQKVAGDLVDSSLRLTSFASGTRSTAQDSAAAVTQLSSSLENVAAHIREQNDAIQKSREDIAEMLRSLKRFRYLVGDLESETAQVARETRQGEQSIQHAVHAVNEIKENTRSINEVLGMITNISEQTNLLALNASIESARAGDAGRGFAVVADEITRLSENTRSSLQQIQKLIKTNDETVERGVAEIQSLINVLSRVVKGMKLIEANTGEVKLSIDTISQGTDAVSHQSREISIRAKSVAVAADEEMKAANQIASIINDLNDQVEGVSRDANLIAASSQLINFMSDDLNDMLAWFQVHRETTE